MRLWPDPKLVEISIFGAILCIGVCIASGHFKVAISKLLEVLAGVILDTIHKGHVALKMGRPIFADFSPVAQVLDERVPRTS